MSEEISAYAKKKKARILRRNIFIGLMIAVLLGTALYFVSTKFLVAQEVMVQGTDLYPKEEILAVCKIPKGAPLVSLSKKGIARAVEENFPYLVDVKVEFDLPRTVSITFQEEFGILAIRLGSELFSIDRDLNVLAKETAETNIPRIQLITEDVLRCVVGEKLVFFEEEQAQEVLDLVRSLENAQMLEHISEVNIKDKFNIRLRYLDRFDLLIGENSDLKQKFAMVKEVVKDLSAEEKGRIDISDPNTAYVKISGDIS